MPSPVLSVVVPAYNEEAVLRRSTSASPRFSTRMDEPAEVLYVNDGSDERTLAVVNRLQPTDPRVAVLDLSRNFGKEIALTAGLHHARGEAVVVIDADLQDPPELIPAARGLLATGGVDVGLCAAQGTGGRDAVPSGRRPACSTC